MRKLTGKWYIQNQLIGYSIMVEVNVTYYDFYGTESPEYTHYEKARPSDLLELQIPIVSYRNKNKK